MELTPSQNNGKNSKRWEIAQIFLPIPGFRIGKSAIFTREGKPNQYGAICVTGFKEKSERIQPF